MGMKPSTPTSASSARAQAIAGGVEERLERRSTLGLVAVSSTDSSTHPVQHRHPEVGDEPMAAETAEGEPAQGQRADAVR
jgi:hypothetical protein